MQWADHFSVFEAKMGITILGKNKHHLFKNIERQHFNSMPGKCFERIDEEEVIERVLERTPIAIEAVKHKPPRDFPGRIAESVF